MKNLSLKVPDPLAVELEAEAAKRGLSKSEVVREALGEHLGRGRGPGSGSVAELAARFLGSVEGAPPDLSSNPEYLDDYGT